MPDFPTSYVFPRGKFDTSSVQPEGTTISSHFPAAATWDA